MLYFWDKTTVCMSLVLIGAMAIVLFLVRRYADYRVRSFGDAIFDVIPLSLLLRTFRFNHRSERLSFTIACVGSFFLVSMYLAKFSMHTIVSNDTYTVDTFQEAAKYNPKYRVTVVLRSHMKAITDIIE